MNVAELASATPSTATPSPVSAPPIEPGARPDATRQSVDLPASLAPTSPTISPSASGEIDVMEHRRGVARVAIADPPQLAASAGPSQPDRRSARRAPAISSPAQDASSGARVGHRPQQVAAAGPAECPQFEGEAALLHVGERRDDHRPHDRQQPAQPRAQAALGVEPTRPLALRDRRRPLDERRDGFERRDATNANRGGTPRRSRSSTKARGSVLMHEQPDRQGDRERAGSASGRRSRRPRASRRTVRSSNRTVDPALVKTRHQDHRDRDRQRQQQRGAQQAPQHTPASVAHASIAMQTAAGPTYPPSANAPIEPTVAMTALVSGFRRW